MGYDFSFRRRQRRPPISVPRQDLVEESPALILLAFDAGKSGVAAISSWGDNHVSLDLPDYRFVKS